ncbi:TetR/AcrR family transcriptional regulator [Streptomyces sp. NPDC021212]|uniref:TetR/AcrR family transcriptional regulator n=1 Tax=Streptomyces sp. NPDC021212 TaxID=3365118 RepID=UPI0037BCCDAA
MSTATAYRHFSSVEEILHAFRSQVGSELREFSARQNTTGMVRLEAGVPLLGVARSGARRCDGADALAPRLPRAAARGHRLSRPQAETLAEPPRQTAEELGLGDLGDEALYLWNALFDPRDILDLIKSGRTEDEAATRLVAALRGALIGRAT